MKKESYKIIKKEFFKYEENKRRANAGVSADSMTATPNFGVRVQTSPTNTPERRIIRELDEVDRCRRWCLVVEKVSEHYKFDIKGKFINLRYIKKLSVVRVCDSVAISRSTYNYWQREILELAALWAKEFRLI